MPFIEVMVYGQRLTPEQRNQLFHRVNEEVKRILATSDGRVRIALCESAAENFFAGANPAVTDRI
ncbi:MAG TPA: tautomerase family protein [Limnochordales bacterium]